MSCVLCSFFPCICILSAVLRIKLIYYYFFLVPRHLRYRELLLLYYYYIIIIVIIIIMNVRTAHNSMVRKAVTGIVGDRATLPCRTTLPTPVDWYYQRSENERGDVICSAGNLVNDYSRRFALDRGIKGEFSLIIQSVRREDEGLYICVEDAGQGTEHHVTLRVYSKHHCVRSLNMTSRF